MIEHKNFKEASLQGRYITLPMLRETCFSKLIVPLIEIGNSVNGEILNAFTLGKGPKKVLMWSQMHGNESTTTKAVWDLVNFLQSDNEVARNIWDSCTIMIVPMLNPDGAALYTRVNAAKIDLNRDAKALTQPESKALRKLFEDFEPDFCFNLHDQRTLFSAGPKSKPATVSFLSPASNQERDITPAREVAMKLIVAMNHILQMYIPGQVGRYDDGFNDNCVGDMFQMLQVPTILFESGHFPKDYEREETRKYIFLAMVEALRTIAMDEIEHHATVEYFKIPENEKLFFDIIVKNPRAINAVFKEGDSVGIRYKEVLKDGKIMFSPEIAEIGQLIGFFGHETIECVDSKDFEQVSVPKEIAELLIATNN